MFSNAMKLFDIFGFQIRVDPSWFIIAALIVWSLSTGYFPEAAPGLSAFDRTTYAIVAMLGLFACLIMHELSHSLVARHFGLGVGGITLFLFGGVAELEQEPEGPRSEFWIAVAGPAMSVALAGVFWIVATAARGDGASAAMVALLDYLALINLVLAVFNLLPAFPLDGGRVLRAILWHLRGDVLSATRTASAAGSALAYALIFLGIFSLFAQGNPVAGLWPILIGLFLLAAAKNTYRQMLMRRSLNGRPVASLMTRNPWTTSPNRTVQEAVEGVMLAHGVSFVPVLEDGRTLGYIDAGVARGIDRENWETTRVDDVFVALTPEMVARPDDPLADLVERIGRTGRRKFLVQEAGRLVGVISLSDLTGFLAVATDVGGPAPHDKTRPA